MDMSALEARKGSKKPLQNVERNVLIAKMIDKLTKGYYSTYALAKELKVSRSTIDNYRPLVDDIIAKTKLDRNVIRNLQVQRTYELIEMLMNDLKSAHRVSERTQLYNQIYKFSSHLALITGINVETHVNIDHQKLVIVRAKPEKSTRKAQKTAVTEVEGEVIDKTSGG